MSLVVPNAIALANIADGSAIVASDHRNNYSAVQVGVNGLIAMFNLGTAKGDLLVATAAGTFDRLGVGTDGQALVADSTQPKGTKYLSGVGGLFTSGLTISAANTDLAFAGGTALISTMVVNTGGGTLRSLGAGSYTGQLVTLRSHFGAALGFTVKHALAGGTGAQLVCRGNADAVLAVSEAITFVWDAGSSLWWEVSRDQAAGAAATSYRKTTAKVVNTTVAATDLLNAEITIAAGAMGTNGLARLTAWGNYLQNSGGNAAMPRFQLVLGGTTLLDTGTSATADAPSATRGGWKIVAEIFNLGAANSQLSSLHLSLSAQGGIGAAGPGAVFTTGDGYYTGILNGTGGIVIGRVAEGTNTTAVDTSTAKSLVLNVINGSASATYETKLLGALVEIV